MSASRPALLLSAALVLLLGCGGGGMSTNTTATSTHVGGTGGTTTVTGSGGVGGVTGGGGTAPSCPACGAPTASGALADASLNEVSGVVASVAHPGVFWVHNDSGDTPRIFAVDGKGQLLGTVTVAGAAAIDWEDIARGPCPAGTCLYLADVGDNNMVRTSYTIYRIPEPATIGDVTVTAEALPFTYPDGAHNCETLLVHPVTGAITLVTKVFVGESSIFELPLPLTPGTAAVAVDKGPVKPPSGSVLYTGGDVHPAGKGVLLRTYGGLWYYPMSAGATVAEALAGTPCNVPVAAEGQGEAVGFLGGGEGYLTIGEGVNAPVNQATCSGL